MAIVKYEKFNVNDFNLLKFLYIELGTLHLSPQSETLHLNKRRWPNIKPHAQYLQFVSHICPIHFSRLALC